MAKKPGFTEVVVKRGTWLYAGQVRKTVIIQCLNYDVYFELEKDDGFDMSDEIPRLNESGYSYLIAWPTKEFSYSPGTWSVPPDERALSVEGAIDYAESVVQQTINWIT